MLRKAFPQDQDKNEVEQSTHETFYMTLSELDETWYVSSACGFMKPDEVSFYLLYGFLVQAIKHSSFFQFLLHWLLFKLVTSTFFICLQNELHHLVAGRWSFHTASSNKVKQRLHFNQRLTFDLSKSAALIFLIFGIDN